MNNFTREDVREIIIKIIQGWYGHAGGSLELPNVAENENVGNDDTIDEHGEECQEKTENVAAHEHNTENDWIATDLSTAAEWS